MAVCHDGVAHTVGKGHLQIFKGNVRRQDDPTGANVQAGILRSAADGNVLVDHPGVVAVCVVGPAQSDYFDDITIVGACHNCSQILDIVSHVGRSGLSVRGQGRTRKCRCHDANRQQGRRDPNSHSVIQKCSSSAPGPQAAPLPPAGNVDAYCNHTMLNSILSFRPFCSRFLLFRQRGLIPLPISF